MFPRRRHYFIFAVFVCAALAVTFFALQNPTAKANLDNNWVTIDLAELKHIEQTAARENQPLLLEVLRIEGGIAVVKATESQINLISEYSHKEFHKCGGFMAHRSESEALETIAAASRAEMNRVFVDYTINNSTTVQALMGNQEASKIVETISALAGFTTRYYTSPTGLQSANWIKNRWTQLAAGRSDVTVEFINHPANVSPQPSVVLTIRGTSEPEEYVVLGAHQDSTRSGCALTNTCTTQTAPGADDDASGIANLTEVIRAAIERNYRPAKTVQFMAYAAEEVGLRGSNAIATDYRSRNVNVLGVLQLDMTNYKGSPASDITIFTDLTNDAQNQFLRNLIAAYLPGLSVTNSQCGYGCSDHASWTAKNYPASFPHESPMNVSNRNIHTANDTLANSDPTGNHALKFSKLAAAFMAELAKGSAASAATAKKRADFDGDGKTDVSVFRPSAASWFLQRSAAGFFAAQFGSSTDIATPADFDGDGKTDLAVFRPTGQGETGRAYFYITNSSNGAFVPVQFGSNGDVPVAGDFDGDGKDDLAVYRNGSSTGAQSYFFYRPSSQPGVDFRAVSWGVAGDKPVVGDFDGDGKTDPAVFRPSDGVWYVQLSSNGQMQAIQFGISTDKAVAADYDGDGKQDIAVYRDGNWFIRKSTGGFSAVQFGVSSDVPVPGDYDGDNKYDLAVFRGGVWYVLKSSDNSFYGVSFGVADDKPLPNMYLPQN